MEHVNLPGGPLCLLAAGLAGEPESDVPAALLVQDGRIKALGRQALEAGAERLDLSPRWLCPAPLDAHVHLCLGGEPEKNLAAWREAGVAAVRDLGHPPAKSLPPAGQAAPLLRASGPGLGAAGEGGSWLAEPLAGPQAFARAAAERARNGACAVKIFCCGLLDFEHPGRVGHPNAIRGEELAAAAGQARQDGLALVAHANGEETVRAAVMAGASSIEHGFFLDEETLWDMSTRAVTWSPTLAAVRAHKIDLEGRHPGWVRRNLGRIARTQARALRQAEALDLPLVLGSDAGSYGLPHGRALFLEMAAWLGAGLDPGTVFNGATFRAAEAMGLEGELGVIAPGARAWLLACEDDPAENPLLMDGAARVGF